MGTQEKSISNEGGEDHARDNFKNDINSGQLLVRKCAKEVEKGEQNDLGTKDTAGLLNQVSSLALLIRTEFHFHQLSQEFGPWLNSQSASHLMWAAGDFLTLNIFAK